MIKNARGPQLEVARIQSEINRLFETLLRLRGVSDPASGTWGPAVDVSESPTHVVLEAELPGVDPETLEITTESGNVTLRGERRPTDLRERDGAEVLHDEREYGPFERIIPLNSAVNTREAQARLADGVLRILFPRVPNRRGQPVPVPFERG